MCQLQKLFVYFSYTCSCRCIYSTYLLVYGHFLLYCTRKLGNYGLDAIYSSEYFEKRGDRNLSSG